MPTTIILADLEARWQVLFQRHLRYAGKVDKPKPCNAIQGYPVAFNGAGLGFVGI